MNWRGVALAAAMALVLTAMRAIREGRPLKSVPWAAAIVAAAVSALMVGYFMLGQPTPAMRMAVGSMLGFGTLVPAAILTAAGRGRGSRAISGDSIFVATLLTLYGVVFALT